MTKELKFQKVNGSPIDNVNEYVSKWAKENPYGEIIIGCDSQEFSRYVKYAIVIVMHYMDRYKVGHGAHVIKSVIVDKINKTPKSAMKTVNGVKNFDTSMLQNKLWKEIEYTVQTAQLLKDCEQKITIHIDYNSKPGTVSNALYAPGIGYAQGLGFEAMGKPYAPVASITADSYCR